MGENLRRANASILTFPVLFTDNGRGGKIYPRIEEMGVVCSGKIFREYANGLKRKSQRMIHSQTELIPHFVFLFQVAKRLMSNPHRAMVSSDNHSEFYYGRSV